MLQYAKAITAAIGAGVTAAISYYPHATWLPIVSAVLTLLATYAIPNVPSSNVKPNDSEILKEKGSQQ